jgi:transposase
VSREEKSQIQALDRTQPGLPLKKRRCGTMTHDYKRNGTTTLFAALNVLNGKVIDRCMQKHRHPAYIRFPDAVDVTIPTGKTVLAIADNYATHKHPKVREWLEAHPGWTFHFPPTSASWLNAVEGFLPSSPAADLAAACSAPSKTSSKQSRFSLAETNQDPRPFTWTKKPKAIFAAVKRGHQVLDSIH